MVTSINDFPFTFLPPKDNYLDEMKAIPHLTYMSLQNHIIELTVNGGYLNVSDSVMLVAKSSAIVYVIGMERKDNTQHLTVLHLDSQKVIAIPCEEIVNVCPKTSHHQQVVMSNLINQNMFDRLEEELEPSDKEAHKSLRKFREKSQAQLDALPREIEWFQYKDITTDIILKHVLPSIGVKDV